MIRYAHLLQSRRRALYLHHLERNATATKQTIWILRMPAINTVWMCTRRSPCQKTAIGRQIVAKLSDATGMPAAGAVKHGISPSACSNPILEDSTWPQIEAILSLEPRRNQRYLVRERFALERRLSANKVSTDTVTVVSTWFPYLRDDGSYLDMI